MRSSNPALRSTAFERAVGGAETMTIQGVVNKSFILMGLLFVTAMYTWQQFELEPGRAMTLVMVGVIGGLVMSLVVSFKPTFAPIGAPIFALLEGLALGGISAAYSAQYDGIVGQALMGTLCVFAAMLLLYRSGTIRVTDRFRRVVVTAMFGVFLVYLLSFVLSMFGGNVPYIHDNGMIGIGFSLVVIVVASLMLAVDFDLIERGVAAGAPKYMEWYGGFALLVTVIWLYLEILRLLSKLRSR